MGGRQDGVSIIKREHRDMKEYIGLMNPTSLGCKYRMNKDSFWMLVDMLSPHLPSTGEEMEKGAVPNGPIMHASCLSMALRYFTGGIHWIFWRCMALMMMNLLRCPELNIVFPETYALQAKCANGFKSKSSININCCIGAIDGMLVWMNKPTIKDQINMGFGPTKFFCGRKMKYGLNMMGVCDSRQRFIWVEVNMPGATSDFYAFDQGSPKKKLQTSMFICPDYCLFRDNAYVDSQYMCTP
ncbi:hypothetical protein ACHAW6_013622 [Cyclotella cf. meneghiniana]